MRTHERVVEVPEPGPADHLCRVYDDPGDAARFLGDGVTGTLDRDTLPLGGTDAPADVTSVHPVVRGPEGVPPFHVVHDADAVLLTGSVDTFTASRLARVLADSPAARPPAVLDVSRLEFVDVAGCRVLARWAADLGGPLEVTGASRLVQRMWGLLGLDRLAPVVFVRSAA